MHGYFIAYAANSEFAATRHFANHVAREIADTLPHRVVIDVGLIQNRGWAVIEANQAWGAGIYGGDPAAILPLLPLLRRPAHSLTPSDRRLRRLLTR